jgi:hypothetical protein
MTGVRDNGEVEMREPGRACTLAALAALSLAGCGGASPVAPPPPPTPVPTVAPTPTPAPEPTPVPSPTPEACDECEEPVSNTNPPVKLTLRLYTVEDGFGKFIANPNPNEPIPVGWYARLDVTGKDEQGDETNGGRPPTWNWTNGSLIDVGGGHTHQRRLKVLKAGSADFWVRQQGVDSNRLSLHFR